MLDVEGFVSETNATNIFMVKGGVLLTPAAGSCLPGITRCVNGRYCLYPSPPPPPLSLSLSLCVFLSGSFSRSLRTAVFVACYAALEQSRWLVFPGSQTDAHGRHTLFFHRPR